MQTILKDNQTYQTLKKIKNNEEISTLELERIVAILLKTRKLEEYCKTITYGISPTYNMIKREIKLNCDYDEYWVESVFDEFITTKLDHLKPKIVDEKKFDTRTYNLLFLFSGLHELRHVEQKKILIEQYNNYETSFLKNLLSSQLSAHFSNYHDKSYHEYDANINAILDLTQLFEEMEFKNIELFNQYLAFKILVAYSNINDTKYSTPLSNNNHLTNQNYDNLFSKRHSIEMYNTMKSAYLQTKYSFTPNKEDIISNIKRGDKLEHINNLEPIYTGEEKSNNLIKKLV
ncbi:MAG: hypothetical protein RSD06_05255 [Bacilli bacterium]